MFRVRVAFAIHSNKFHEMRGLEGLVAMGALGRKPFSFA